MDNELPLTGMYGCEVGGTVTTGVLMYCVGCENKIIAEWNSFQKFPRLQELVDEWNKHTKDPSHREYKE